MQVQAINVESLTTQLKESQIEKSGLEDELNQIRKGMEELNASFQQQQSRLQEESRLQIEALGNL